MDSNNTTKCIAKSLVPLSVIGGDASEELQISLPIKEKLPSLIIDHNILELSDIKLRVCSSVADLDVQHNYENSHKWPVSICNFTGNKDSVSEGILYIGFSGNSEKTNPKKVCEWFSSDFLLSKNVYAIEEEEPFLLKLYTNIHGGANNLIRRRGGRKCMLLGKEVYGEIIVACGRCGYYSSDVSNVRRHLYKEVCLKDRGYCKQDLKGLDKFDRQKFIKRIASAKFRARKRTKTIERDKMNGLINEDEGKDTDGNCGNSVTSTKDDKTNIALHKKPFVAKALTLGTFIEKTIIKKISYEVFTINKNNVRVAWKPPFCHKASDEQCHIVFKGARMKRRFLDLPLPGLLFYRKLNCKVHNCSFTHFHPHCRKRHQEESEVLTSLAIRMVGDTVMTHEFYHYLASLLSVMKMKPSQVVRHLSRVWRSILCDRLSKDEIPDEYRALLTLSKQTVKSIWSSGEGAKSSSLLNLKSIKRKKAKANHEGTSQLKQPLPEKNSLGASFENDEPTEPLTSNNHFSPNVNRSHYLNHLQHPYILPKICLPHSSSYQHSVTSHPHTPHWINGPHIPNQCQSAVSYPVPSQHDLNCSNMQESFVNHKIPSGNSAW